MGVMYDSVDASKIPTDAEIVAGYINGKYKWSDDDWARFPNAQKVRIQIFIPGHDVIDDGDVLDIEAGDAPKEEAQQAAERFVSMRPGRPCIYTSKSGLQYLTHVANRCVFWIADPTEVPHLLPNTVATQWGFKGAYDVSTTADNWPLTTGEEHVMAKCGGIKLTKSGKGYWLWGDDGSIFAYGDAKLFGAGGVESAPFNALGMSNNPFRDFAVTDAENGYYFVDEAFNVYAFGDAVFLGHP